MDLKFMFTYKDGTDIYLGEENIMGIIPVTLNDGHVIAELWQDEEEGSMVWCCASVDSDRSDGFCGTPKKAIEIYLDKALAEAGEDLRWDRKGDKNNG